MLPEGPSSNQNLIDLDLGSQSLPPMGALGQAETNHFLTEPQLVYQMNCPRCQKNYSVDAEQILSVNHPLKFQCLGCQTRFAAQWVAPEDGHFGAGRVVTFEPEPSAQPTIRFPLHQTEIAPTQQRTRTAVEQVPTVSESRCPKCGSRNSLSSEECRYCGIVFAKYKPHEDSIEGEIRLSGNKELTEMWEAVMKNYDSIRMHEKFVDACRAADCLGYASSKYSRILSVTPQEDIALAMKNRIIGFASYRMDFAKETGLWSFRVPKLNNLVLILGSAAVVTGLILPAMKSVAGVGFAAILLALFVRFLLKPTRF